MSRCTYIVVAVLCLGRFPQPLAGLDPQPPLQASDIWPGGHPGGQGLVAVGSHVGLTNRQVAVARECGGLVEVELEVPAIIGQKLGFQSSLVTAIPWVFALVGLLIFPGLADRTRRHTG